MHLAADPVPVPQDAPDVSREALQKGEATAVTLQANKFENPLQNPSIQLYLAGCPGMDTQ